MCDKIPCYSYSHRRHLLLLICTKRANDSGILYIIIHVYITTHDNNNIILIGSFSCMILNGVSQYICMLVQSNPFCKLYTYIVYRSERKYILDMPNKQQTCIIIIITGDHNYCRHRMNIVK